MRQRKRPAALSLGSAGCVLLGERFIDNLSILLSELFPQEEKRGMVRHSAVTNTKNLFFIGSSLLLEGQNISNF